MSNVVALSVNVSVKSETKNENTHQFHLVWKLCFRICCHLRETQDLKEMHCVECWICHMYLTYITCKYALILDKLGHIVSGHWSQMLMGFFFLSFFWGGRHELKLSVTTKDQPSSCSLTRFISVSSVWLSYLYILQCLTCYVLFMHVHMSSHISWKL